MWLWQKQPNLQITTHGSRFVMVFFFSSFRSLTLILLVWHWRMEANQSKKWHEMAVSHNNLSLINRIYLVVAVATKQSYNDEINGSRIRFIRNEWNKETENRKKRKTKLASTHQMSHNFFFVVFEVSKNTIENLLHAGIKDNFFFQIKERDFFWLNLIERKKSMYEFINAGIVVVIIIILRRVVNTQTYHEKWMNKEGKLN